jgi:glycosyltransferase involved in cell wall biosynthesis
MKVLVFPNQIEGNPYFKSFMLGLRTAGIEDVRLSSVLRFKSGFDAMHFHHPDQVVTQGSWLKSVVVAAAVLSVAVFARLTGRPVVWMVHDVEPAWIRRKIFLGAFMEAITSLVTAYIFLNNSSQKVFYGKRPQEAHKPFCFAPHSRFQTPTFSATTLQAHRQAYGVGETDILIGVLGSITPHKGVEYAALIPDQTKSGRAVKVVVCGVIDDVLPRDNVDAIFRHKPDHAYIRVPNRLTDDELALWIQCSDAVFLSYRLGSNSGMAFNVLSNHRRIIASDLPMFKELAERCGPTWVRCVDVSNVTAMSEIVECFESWNEQKPDLDRLETILTEGDPVENGRKLRDFYLDLRQHPFATPPVPAG